MKQEAFQTGKDKKRPQGRALRFLLTGVILIVTVLLPYNQEPYYNWTSLDLIFTDTQTSPPEPIATQYTVGLPFRYGLFRDDQFTTTFIQTNKYEERDYSFYAYVFDAALAYFIALLISTFVYKDSRHRVIRSADTFFFSVVGNIILFVGFMFIPGSIIRAFATTNAFWETQWLEMVYFLLVPIIATVLTTLVGSAVGYGSRRVKPAK